MSFPRMRRWEVLKEYPNGSIAALNLRFPWNTRFFYGAAATSVKNKDKKWAVKKLEG